MTARLTMLNHGIDGIALGVHGAWEFAMHFGREGEIDVYRRRADEAGGYGGWRWETSWLHLRTSRGFYPKELVLAAEEAVKTEQPEYYRQIRPLDDLKEEA